MSAKELLLRVLLELRPMLPGIAAVVAASLLVLPTLLVCCKTTTPASESPDCFSA